MLDAGVRKRGAKALLIIWGVLVLGVFIAVSPAVERYSARSLAVLGLAALIAYIFWFSGFRLRRRLSRWLPSEDSPLGSTLMEFGLGVSGAFAVLMAAGAIGLFRPPLAWAALGAALLGPHRAFLLEVRTRWVRFRAGGNHLGGDADSGHGSRSGPLFGALAVVAALSLVSSLAPVTTQDALVYHLAVPAEYVRAGGFVHVEGNFFASFPQNVELLFTLSLLLGNPPLAQVLHWLFAVLAVAAVGHLSCMLGPRTQGLGNPANTGRLGIPGSRGSAWLAATAFGTIPTVCLIAAGAYVDLAVVFFVVLSTTAFLRWMQGGGAGGRARDEVGWLVVAALFAGVAAGCKYTAGFQGILVAAGAFLVAGILRRNPRRGVALGVLSALVVGAVVSPWLIKNAIFTGNPVYPFCHAIFGGRGWDSESARTLSEALAQWGGPRHPLDAVVIPWRLTMDGEFLSFDRFDGVIGCVFLIGLPCILLGLRLSTPFRVAALFMVAHFVFWNVTTRQVRFLLPSLACASAMLGASVPAFLGPAWSRTVFGVALHLAMAVGVILGGVEFAGINPLPVVLGLEKEESFLRRAVPGGDYAVFEYIEREVPEDSFIFFASLGNPGFLCKRRYYADAFIENRTLLRMLREARDADDLLGAFGKRGFTHFLFRFDNVFDVTERRSGIPVRDQRKLMDFLNRHGRILIERARTYLYEIREGSGPLPP